MGLEGIDHPSTIYNIRQILEKKLEHNKEILQLFIDFVKAYE